MASSGTTSQTFPYCLRSSLVEIASYLPMHSIAALALCNHRLLGILSDPYIARLKHTHNQPERDMLVQSLTRDKPDAYFCYACRKLHFLSLYRREKLATNNWLDERHDSTNWHMRRKEHYNTLGETRKLPQIRDAVRLLQLRFEADVVQNLKSASIAESYPQRLGPKTWRFELWDACLIQGELYDPFANMGPNDGFPELTFHHG